MFGSRGRLGVNNRFGTEAQRTVTRYLYDDDANVLTTFDMNKIASLTYSEETCGEIFDLLEHTLAKVMDFTMLTIQKTLVLIEHLVVYGSEKAVNEAWRLREHVAILREYNTVLLAQNNKKSLSGYLTKIKGGGVDRGHPVRTVAIGLYELLLDKNKIMKTRADKADPNSLVPVGTHDDVGFVSDEIRLEMLRDRIAHQQEMNLKKSNLKKAAGGYGGGYNPANGEKNVVGAAHSIEEMLELAKKKESLKYRDTGPDQEEIERMQHLQKLEREMKQKTNDNANNSVVVDLLDFDNDSSVMPKQNCNPPFPSSINQVPDFFNTQQTSVQLNNQQQPESSEDSTQNDLLDIGNLARLTPTSNNESNDHLSSMLGNISLSNQAPVNTGLVQSNHLHSSLYTLNTSHAESKTTSTEQYLDGVILKSSSPPTKGVPSLPLDSPPPPPINQPQLSKFSEEVDHSIPMGGISEKSKIPEFLNPEVMPISTTYNHATIPSTPPDIQNSNSEGIKQPVNMQSSIPTVPQLQMPQIPSNMSQEQQEQYLKQMIMMNQQMMMMMQQMNKNQSS
mmetsp:Transcript_13697/g.19581  ORF Transcript_13697/g.19581 Transcript_13697/m.19581 type:complete len:562 (-) Transcript_13697:404-2089(-)